MASGGRGSQEDGHEALPTVGTDGLEALRPLRRSRKIARASKSKGMWSNKRGRGENFDAVVVGGGPVGRWLACELALAKAVLERRYISRRAPRHS